MTYIQPHMKESLQGHQLTCILDAENIQVFTLRRPADSMFRVQITFTPEGIAIQGDIGLGEPQNGICSRLGLGLEWFSKQRADGQYICSKFLSKKWQHNVAERDLKWRVRQAQEDLDNAKQDAKTLLSAEGPARSVPETDFSEEQETLEAWTDIRNWFHGEYGEHELYEYGTDRIPDFLDYEIGLDFPLSDAGWLCAIQAKFAELYAAS